MEQKVIQVRTPDEINKGLIPVLDLTMKLSSYSTCLNKIGQCLVGVRNNFFNLGKYLNEVKVNKLFEIDNYKDIYEFAEDKFGIKSTSTKNFINIFLTYKNDVNELDSRFENFNCSQLIELLPLAIDDKEFSSKLVDCTSLEIRSIKKEINLKDEKDKVLIVIKNKVIKLLTSILSKYSYDDVLVLQDKISFKYMNKAVSITLSFNDLSFYLYYYLYDFNFVFDSKRISFNDDFTENLVNYFDNLNSNLEDFKKSEEKKEDEVSVTSDDVVVEDCSVNDDESIEVVPTDLINDLIDHSNYELVDLNSSKFDYYKFNKIKGIFLSVPKGHELSLSISLSVSYDFDDSCINVIDFNTIDLITTVDNIIDNPELYGYKEDGSRNE